MAQSDTAVKSMAGMNLLLGLWLVATPFVFQAEAFGAATLPTAAFWNAIIVGVLIAVLAGANLARASQHRRVSTGAATGNLLAGLWVMATPFVFALGQTQLWNHVIVGLLVAVFAATNLYQASQTHPRVSY